MCIKRGNKCALCGWSWIPQRVPASTANDRPHCLKRSGNNAAPQLWEASAADRSIDTTQWAWDFDAHVIGETMSGWNINPPRTIIRTDFARSHVLVVAAPMAHCRLSLLSTQSSCLLFPFCENLNKQTIVLWSD